MEALPCFLDIYILPMATVLLVLEMKIHEKYLGYWKFEKSPYFILLCRGYSLIVGVENSGGLNNIDEFIFMILHLVLQVYISYWLLRWLY